MNKFTKLTSCCLLIRTENIDTDQIIPAVFLKTSVRKGLGKYLFYYWRFDENGKPKKNSYFHCLIDESIKILIAGNNFGCGSSREHAVWALQDFGFDAVISSSFGDIFYNNSLKNGLFTVVLTPKQLEQLIKIIEKNSKTEVEVDLEKQEVNLHQQSLVFHFPVDLFHKTCLIKGVDELGYILRFEKKIKDFEKRCNHQYISI